MISRFTAGFLAASLLLTGCGASSYRCTDPLGCLTISPNDPVVIGALITVEGSQGKTGLTALAELKNAIAGTGTILGHEITLDWQGDDCTEAGARVAATLLTLDTDLTAVIGPTCAADAPFALSILTDAGLAEISLSPNATAAFQRLIQAIEQAAIQQINGTLIIPRTKLQQQFVLLP